MAVAATLQASASHVSGNGTLPVSGNRRLDTRLIPKVVIEARLAEFPKLNLRTRRSARPVSRRARNPARCATGRAASSTVRRFEALPARDPVHGVLGAYVGNSAFLPDND